MPLSRTYRPQFFRDVTGQQHITETLRREVEMGMLGHSYLFSGPRGVGKTTTARIFAKALLNEETDHGEPPAESEVNKQVDQGSCIDFIEIDAASHTGVDHVREVIIEHVRFAPARWKRKVYVIDECHMLSTSAWNALLKTLEEPPEYAFFILATTELHKVPETIKSRCQRFEFKRIAPHALSERIMALAKAETVTIDDSVVRQIVHASDGCLRDAESLMDQLISLGEKIITQEIAGLVLPASMLPKTAVLLEHIANRDISTSLSYTKQLLEEGVSPVDVLQDVLQAVRMLLRAQDPTERARFESGDEGDRAIMKLFERFSVHELTESALTLLERRKDIKSGTDPLFSLELAICTIAGGLLPHAAGAIEQTPRSSFTPPKLIASNDEKKAQIKTNNRESVSRSVGESVSEPESQSVSEEVSRREDEIESSRPSIHMEEVERSGQTSEEPNAQHPTPNTLSFDIHDVRKYWSLIIKEVEKVNHSIPFILKTSQPDHLEGFTIHIRFQYSFHREKLLEDMKTHRIVEGAIRTVLKNDRILIDGFCRPKSEEAAGDRLEQAPADVVSRVLSAFGGQIVE